MARLAGSTLPLGAGNPVAISTLALQILFVVAGNAVLVWLVGTGEMRPFDLVLLVLVEALLLWLIAIAVSRFDPQPPKSVSLKEGWFAWLFLLAWLGGVYGVFVLAMQDGWTDLQRLLRDPPDYLRASSISVPLAVTLCGTLVASLLEVLRFRREGGALANPAGMEAGARIFTLVLGGIPFAIGLFALAMVFGNTPGDVAVAREKRVVRRVGVGVLLVLAMIAAVLNNPAGWWAAGFCGAKLVMELLLTAMPVLQPIVERDRGPSSSA